ncbi:MAG: FkbM family methyltransferase [Oligoflexia bacterium]|nr:FkbM family methyltransferase [Oligoflexia bacterium]
MKLNNTLSVFIARKRWLKRIFMNCLPNYAHRKIFNKIEFYFDPRDMRGPSFHFAYDLEKGFNNYEETTKKKLLSFLPENGVFYDIGANIGMYSVYFLLHKPSCQLFSFEPEPLVHSLLNKTLKSMKNDIKLFNVAIGNVEEDKKIFKSSTNDGGHSFLIGLDDKNDESYEVVKVVNLDSFRQKNSIPKPDVVKIDVEGFELEVLKGMKGTILESKPIMQIESNNKDLSTKGNFWQFMSQFVEHGLVCMTPDDTRSISLNELSNIAKRNLDNGHALSDYFYIFQK